MPELFRGMKNYEKLRGNLPVELLGYYLFKNGALQNPWFYN